MAATSRLQINFERLLNVCEKQIAESDDENRWRVQKYVSDLNDKLTLLSKQSCNKTHPELMKDYTKRVALLKGILDAENKETPSDKMAAAQSLPIPRSVSVTQESTPSQSKEILLHAKAKFSNESRRALLGEARADGLRQRGGVGPAGESDLDAMIHYHQQVQERVADDMVLLARTMKDHVKAASKMVQDDNKKLQDINKLADTNYEQLKIESARLEEHTKKSNWWMLLLLLFVVIVFVWMIIFMKLFPKA